MTRTPQILVVDDHREIRDAVTSYLERNGYPAISAREAREMDAALKTHHIDLVVLDVMLPGEDGLSACRRLRAGSDIPILMLTARGEDIDRIIGLEIGADDYLAKPFTRVNCWRASPPSSDASPVPSRWQAASADADWAATAGFSMWTGRC